MLSALGSFTLAVYTYAIRNRPAVLSLLGHPARRARDAKVEVNGE
jgi:hypothetical protein